jgi:hypothetical protein
VVSLAEGSGYVPLKDVSIGGIIMVRQAQPGAPEELVEPVAGMQSSKIQKYCLTILGTCF